MVNSTNLNACDKTLPPPNKMPRRQIFSFGGDTGGSIWVFPNIGGKPPEMDGLFHGKPYEQIDDLGGPPLFLETPI